MIFLHPLPNTKFDLAHIDGAKIPEAKAASALNHPNILTIHEIGEFEDSRFVVSEYVKGETVWRSTKG